MAGGLFPSPLGFGLGSFFLARLVCLVPARGLPGIGKVCWSKILLEESAGPDYGVFEFCNLFSEAVLDRPYLELTSTEKSGFTGRFEAKVSDHMPLWVRLPLPV